MTYEDLVETPLWGRFSKKMGEKIVSPRNAGHFSPDEERQMRVVEGRVGQISEAKVIALYWLVDETDGIVVDAKFQVFGSSALIALADAVCELIVGKNYDQAKRIGAELIDKKLRDKPEIAAVPEECAALINLVIEAVDVAAEKCLDIPLSTTYVSPVPQTEGGIGYPGWLSLSHEKKLAVIEEILNVEVRPYVELDEGGIEVQELINNKELIIAYKGACTSCFSAIGATLSTIQQIMQTKVHPDLVVVPNMDELTF